MRLTRLPDRTAFSPHLNLASQAPHPHMHTRTVNVCITHSECVHVCMRLPDRTASSLHLNQLITVIWK